MVFLSSSLVTECKRSEDSTKVLILHATEIMRGSERPEHKWEHLFLCELWVFKYQMSHKMSR